MKAKSAALFTVQILGVLLAWCCLMALYLTARNLVEESAVPVSLGPKDFMDASWLDGYFTANGSFENQSAITPGDELLLQTNTVTCEKAANRCTVATAEVLDHYLHLDVSPYDITSWTDQEITFSDDSPICATDSYVINRAARSVTLITRRRAIIPDYALKSPLHPCDNVKDANIDLADGIQVYLRRKTEFDARNGIYFHVALAFINVAFVGVVVWSWRRRKPVAHKAVFNS